MVSIPRDSYVDIPDYGTDKINASFAVGGAPLLAQTVEQATGVRLDHYAEVEFDGFARLVDAVGGVTMCPPEPISDPLAGIELPAGCQKLDGRNALGYVRTRATPRADLDRMVNQRQFMSTLVHRAASPSVVLNPLRWYPMANAAADSMTVDSGAHVWDLARLAWALHGDITTTTVPIGEFTGSDSGSVVVWDEAVADQLFAALKSDAPVPPDVLEAGRDPLVAARPGQPVLQPILGAPRMIGRNPGNPDLAAVPHVLVMVDGPAVQRPALGGRPVHELRVLAQRRDRRSDRGGADRGCRAATEVSRRLTEQDRRQHRGRAADPPHRRSRERHHHRARQVRRRGRCDAVAVQQRQHLALHKRAVAHRMLGLDEELHRPVPVQHQRHQVVEGQQTRIALRAVGAANWSAMTRSPAP